MINDLIARFTRKQPFRIRLKKVACRRTTLQTLVRSPKGKRTSRDSQSRWRDNHRDCAGMKGNTSANLDVTAF